MSLTTNGTRITSDQCPNIAELHAGGWSVTGYPGRLFDRDQAMNAMLLAELLSLIPTADDKRRDQPRSDRTSSLITTWGAASSAKTTTAPQDPATHKATEVHSS